MKSVVTDDLNELKSLIRKYFHDNGLSIRRASMKIGIGENTLQSFMNGDRNITIYNLIDVCSFCNIQILFKKEDDNE